ncbi:GSCOCT00011387001.2-RA-CDS, partial [Cotesia congregata]
TDTKRAKRLFNGNDVEPDEYPFTVSILLNNTHICVGITIGEKHILTAAHCFGNLPLVALANLVVRSGSIFYNSGGNLHSVKKIIYHREYRIGDTTSPNDIAILELNNPITLDDHCKIISLSSTFVQTGAIATVIGWGHTESLRKTNPSLKQLTLTILDPLTCQAYMPYTMYTHQICAIGFLNQGTCVGDSGGPLV